MSPTITLAPLSRKRLTVARPIPDAPPVTIATFPSSRFMGSGFKAKPRPEQLSDPFLTFSSMGRCPFLAIG
jgi:hypothetical protein